MSLFKTPIAFVATTDAAACRHFYESVLALECLSDGPFALVFDLGPTTLRIQKVQSLVNVSHTVLGWEVEDIVLCVNELSQRGVTFDWYTELPQDENGAWSSPSGVKVALFKDPDGNQLSVTQP